MSWQLFWCIRRSLQESKCANRCQSVSKGVRRYHEMSWQFSWGVRKSLKASKSANWCQRVSKGLLRYQEMSWQLSGEVSGDVYRHPRVPMCVKKCQKVWRDVLTIVVRCQEMSTGIQNKTMLHVLSIRFQSSVISLPISRISTGCLCKQEFSSNYWLLYLNVYMETVLNICPSYSATKWRALA